METSNPFNPFRNEVPSQPLDLIKDVKSETPMTMKEYLDKNLRCGEVPSDFGLKIGCGKANWRAFRPAVWPHTCWQLICNECGRRVAVEVLFNGAKT